MEELEKKECDFTEESQIEIEYVYFTVPGAGEIQLSRSTSVRTGGVEGFSFGVEWVDMDMLVEFYQKRKVLDWQISF